MSNSVIFWIIAGILIICATVLIVWLRHNFKIQKIKFKTGLVETELERTVDKAENLSNDISVNISKNKMFGWNKILVRREKTNVSENIMAGENEIEVGAKPGPKSKHKKGKANQ